MAAQLYDSIHKLLLLPDHVKVFPAHGAGSLCGRNISSERSSTIGHERRFNYALRPMSREEFVRLMIVDLPEAPGYFSMDQELNRAGPELLENLPSAAPLSPGDCVDAITKGAVVLDTRPAAQYGAAHIPGSLNISLAGQFASWAGTLIKPSSAIILVSEDEDKAREACTRLARVGLEKTAGHLAGGILAWSAEGRALNTTEQIGVDELAARLNEAPPPQVLDVRAPSEWSAGHIPQAIHVPLSSLPNGVSRLERGHGLAVVCAGGYRSSVATSILEQQGFRNVTNIVGGMAAWKSAKLPVV
jgi:rhodanese-related sulfurtransferase